MSSISMLEVKAALQEQPQDSIKKIEAAHWEQLYTVAESIAANRDTCPIILLSGPSGSGKTITSMMLASILKRMGLETHTLSMDNYFKGLTDEEHKLAEAGAFDLESPDRMDMPFLNAQLQDIRDGKPVTLPKYDFRIAKRVSSGKVLQRKEKELVILEGLHAMNPNVITLSEAARCYVSVQTTLQAPDVQLTSSDIRLLRRMIRDQKYRKRAVTETIQMHHSVQAGEDAFVKPYQHLATYTIDTFLPYETFAYAAILQPIPEVQEIASQVPALKAIFQNAIPFSLDWIPDTALIREFIGGSFYYHN